MLTTYMRRLRGRSFEGELSWNMPERSGAACVRALEVVSVEEEAPADSKPPGVLTLDSLAF